jgi:hypothetical protein
MNSERFLADQQTYFSGLNKGFCDDALKKQRYP